VSPNDLAWFDWGSGGESTIFTVDSDGSHLRQVTIARNPPGQHADPSWSPDGKHLVFAALGQMGARASINTLWTVDAASGELKRIATGNLVNQVSPVVSPDGQTVYFGALAADGFGVYSAPLSGNAPAVALYRTGKDVPTGITLSRDGRRLFFTRMRTVSQIWQTGTEASPAKALYQDEVVRAKLPAYSPDGKRLAYVVQPQNATQDLWMMDADGSNATPVVSDQGFANGPGWTADSKAIWYTFASTGGFQIRKFQPADGSQQVLLDSKEYHNRTHLTPDMRDLVYESGRPPNIWILPLQGGSPRQLTFDREGAGFPAVSPDGQWIAYQLNRGDGTFISIMDRNGEHQRTLLASPGAHYAYSFASDNRRIAYTACPDGVWNVYWIDRITGETKQVTNYTAYGSVVRSPAWRPGAEQMAFEFTEVKGNVYAIDLPGSPR
jgi:Tol biopolymer transport system component